MAFPLSRSFLLASVLVASVLPLGAMAPAELAERLARNEPVLLVDVRPAHHYAEGHIPGAINIPLALLPHKPLPSAQPVVIYADGLGQVDGAQALAAAAAKPGVKAELLDGGYAAWLAATRLSTQAPGVTAERLPGITYDQLTAGAQDDVVIVDLRSAAPAKAAGARAMTVERDEVAEFAAQLGLPVVKAADVATGGSDAAGAMRSLSTAGSRTAKAAPSPAKTDQLWVLVADNETEAAELARQLRASGHYRFTVLIGGVEAIRHQGRTGLGRMDGRSGATQP